MIIEGIADAVLGYSLLCLGAMLSVVILVYSDFTEKRRLKLIRKRNEIIKDGIED